MLSIWPSRYDSESLRCTRNVVLGEIRVFLSWPLLSTFVDVLTLVLNFCVYLAIFFWAFYCITTCLKDISLKMFILCNKYYSKSI